MGGLSDKIGAKDLHLALVGCGYVGLPMAALFADVGFRVTCIDKNSEVVEIINEGRSPFPEPGLEEIVDSNVKAGRLTATTSYTEGLKWADVVLVSVQTPVDENRRPDLTTLRQSLGQIGKSIRRGTLVTIVSTVPPGTILGEVKNWLESSSRLHVGNEILLAYAPERSSPGKTIREFAENPRLVAGWPAECTQVVVQLFETICNGIIPTDIESAEVAKLAENTYRDINIAFANQLALICERCGVDVVNAVRMANSHPRVSIADPGPGVGGPCLTKDPYFLDCETDAREMNLIRTARMVNDYMPRHVVVLVARALKQIGKAMEHSTLAVLGSAYKGNVADGRESPSRTLIQELLRAGAAVRVHDPFCRESFGGVVAATIESCVKDADCMILMTDHEAFKTLNLRKIRDMMQSKPLIVDARRILNPSEAEHLGFAYFEIGRAHV